MTRAAQVMDVLRRAPAQVWSPAEISAQLGCAPGVVRGTLGVLRRAGSVERISDGRYRLPAAVTPSRPAARPTPSLPPGITPAHVTLVVTVLQDVGRAVSRSFLLTRLAGRGLNFTVLQAVLEHLTAAGRVHSDHGQLFALVPGGTP